MSSTNSKTYILAAKRTPIGSFLGSLRDCSAPQLGAATIKETINQAQITKNAIDSVTMGCVLSAGVKQAPARQAALSAGLAISTPCATMNKICGSGMYSVMTTHDSILAKSVQCAIAGGMESMSNAPYLLPKARTGYRLSHQKVLDSMFVDGLEDAYEGKLMGCYAQNTADTYNYSREAMDNFAKSSLKKAITAQQNGYFEDEITPLTYNTIKGEVKVSQDEQPQKVNPNKISTLRPAFLADGTVTAANSSSISDGAASLLIASEQWVTANNAKPIASIIAHATHAQKPAEFTLAPIGAIQKVLAKTGWTMDEVELFEINEAFAVVTMVCADQLGIDMKKINITGGACALGHPLGASGARIITTLIHQMRRLNYHKGIASLCIGGGEATAIAIEINQ